MHSEMKQRGERRTDENEHKKKETKQGTSLLFILVILVVLFSLTLPL